MLGNHAQGVAYSAQKLGIKAKIVMPVPTPAIKVKKKEVILSFKNSINIFFFSGEMSKDLAQKLCYMVMILMKLKKNALD